MPRHLSQPASATTIYPAYCGATSKEDSSKASNTPEPPPRKDLIYATLQAFQSADSSVAPW
jgi:hypothetical protein